QGTGLGLSLCQSIINTHNGEITCENVPGQGTKFKILLPAATAKDAKGAKNVTAEPQKAQKKEKDTENATAKDAKGAKNVTAEPQKAQKKEKDTENATAKDAKGAKERKRHRECNRKGRKKWIEKR
ncbi:unnamed protein product, partial [marine sediment metagenome]